MLGPDDGGVGVDCIVRFAEVYENSVFLDKFLTGALGFETNVYLYDLAGHRPGDAGFVQPKHLAIDCDSGDVDIVFENMIIDT